MVANLGKKMFFNDKIFNNWSYILYILVFLQFSVSYKFTFRFKSNKNTEILFFLEKKDNIFYENETKYAYKLDFINSTDSMPFRNKKYCFVYRKNNYINFEVLNKILTPKTSENKYYNGIIECNFDLSFFLKMTKDITEISDEINEYKFQCILLTLQYFKAVENKNLIKFFQTLMHKISNSHITKLKKINFKFEAIFDFHFSKIIDRFLKYNLMQAFLKNCMMKYVFCDDNLVLLDNNRDSFETSLFHENIPYNNLLINNYTIFCKLENILRDSYTLNTFQTLLTELNMKSLIINNYKATGTSDINTNFFILSMYIFKSIIIVNFVRNPSSIFLDKVNDYIEKNIEFLGLINFVVYRAELIRILKKEKLKGLVLNCVNTFENLSIIEDCIVFSKQIEYIDFKEIGMYFTWWSNIFKTENIRKIILSFSNSFSTRNFIAEFYKVKLYSNVLYFEITFCNNEIDSKFCYSLSEFKSLQTFKISKFKTNEITERLLLKAIKGMYDLEFLSIQQYSICSDSYNVLFKMRKIKVMHLVNFVLGNIIPKINFFRNYTSLTKLFFMNMKISQKSLTEIFKLEYLIDLSLKYCFLQSISDSNLPMFMSKKIRAVNFDSTNIRDIKGDSILNYLDCIELLDLSGTYLPCGYLKNLSPNCNHSLKCLSYESGDLDINDLSRIEKLNVLEKLDLRKCKLRGCSFSELSDFCRFFNSLKYLDIWLVDIGSEDLKYLKRFKNLKELKCRHFGFNIQEIKNFFVSSHINQFSTDNIDEETFYDSIGKILYEQNIELFD